MKRARSFFGKRSVQRKGPAPLSESRPGAVSAPRADSRRWCYQRTFAPTWIVRGLRMTDGTLYAAVP